MKRTVVGTLSIAALMAGLVVVSPPTQAGGCVTPREFARAKTGMTMAQVHAIFGTKGRESARTEGFGITIVMRDYEACTAYGAVSVMYENGRLTSKASVF